MVVCLVIFSSNGSDYPAPVDKLQIASDRSAYVSCSSNMVFEKHNGSVMGRFGSLPVTFPNCRAWTIVKFTGFAKGGLLAFAHPQAWYHSLH